MYKIYSLFTYDCTPVHGSNTIVKFADDTTVIGLISDNDESAYREEVQHLAVWCADNNLLFLQAIHQLLSDCEAYSMNEFMNAVRTVHEKHTY